MLSYGMSWCSPSFSSKKVLFWWSTHVLPSQYFFFSAIVRVWLKIATEDVCGPVLTYYSDTSSRDGGIPYKHLDLTAGVTSGQLPAAAGAGALCRGPRDRRLLGARHEDLPAGRPDGQHRVGGGSDGLSKKYRKYRLGLIRSINNRSSWITVSSSARGSTRNADRDLKTFWYRPTGICDTFKRD